MSSRVRDLHSARSGEGVLGEGGGVRGVVAVWRYTDPAEGGGDEDEPEIRLYRSQVNEYYCRVGEFGASGMTTCRILYL